ncbi:GrpB family protein [Nesterenkonia sp.]|uniref:GrpB family protein n=1 Tax=Nesterenkonia sp. TaxID=704201 RepID=UPI00260E004F|nr:GrpB family protein [Nesterenkonia sp.]
MLEASEIVTFRDVPPPPGESPWVNGSEPPREEIAVVAPDPRWPEWFQQIADRIRSALGMRALSIEHVGSTAVPGLPAKPVIDIDLIVADSSKTSAWLPQLQQAGFTHTVSEPWWYKHHCLRLSQPRCNLHVWSPGCPEAYRHRLFRDWLRHSPADRDLYRDAKRAAAEASNSGRESVEEYNQRKQDVIRQIYQRAFSAAGLLDP